MPLFKLKWNKEEFDVVIETNSTVESFKLQVRALTSVPVDRQKYLGLPGGMLKDTDDLMPRLAKMKPGAKITLMGTAEASQLKELTDNTTCEKDLSLDTKARISKDVGRKDETPEMRPTVANRTGNAHRVRVAGRRIKRDLASDFTMEMNQFNTRWLGTGTNGPVRQAIRKDNGAKYAVKRLSKKELTLEQQTDLQGEVDIFLSLDHPHVVRLEWLYETEEVIDLVMEVMEGGHLYDRIHLKKWYAEREAANIIYQMLLAVSCLHSHKIVHRDLKPENFLFEKKETDHVKLIDFGVSRFWDPSADEKMSRFCGTLAYMSPQVLGHSYTEKADMWSMGVIVYLSLMGTLPFGPFDESMHVDEKRIRHGDVQWSLRFPELSYPAQDFVKALLVVDPTRRLSATDALGHSWIGNNRARHECAIDTSVWQSLRNFPRLSHFRRIVLSTMAWSLTREDCLQLRDQFLEFDTDRNGTITLNELKHVLESSETMDNDEIKQLFDGTDTDGDLEIAYSDFLAASLQDPARVHPELFQSAFRRFDVQCTGKITVQSLRDVTGDLFEECDVAEMIGEVARREEGWISYEDFLDHFQHCDSVQAETPKSCRAEESAQSPPLHRTKKLCMR
jgi:calcium-dependent protein kinase